MNKISVKIFLTIILIIIIAAGLVLAFSLYQQISVIRNNLISSYRTLARTTSETVQRGYLTKNWPLESLSNLVKEKNILFCWVVDNTGDIQIAGQAKYFGQEYKDENLGTHIPKIKSTLFDGKPIKLIAYPIFVNQIYPWTLYLGASIEPLILARDKTIYFGLIVFLVILLISALLAVFLTRPLISPILKLTKAAGQLSQGRFPSPLKVKTNDEIGQLTASFNEMVKSLELSEKMLKERAEQLERALKLKTEFLHIVNHQLRTPISILRGYLAFWKDGSFKNFSLEKQTEMRQAIITAADRLANLTNAMIDSMETEGGVLKLKIEPINLKEFILSVYEKNLKSLYREKNLYFRINYSQEPILIESDSRYLAIVIQNLLNNAWEFTFKGGVTVDLEKSGNFVIIKIIDTGIGLSEEDRNKLFKQFSRGEIASSVSPSGSGLGLYICRQILNSLNGEIEAYSKGRNQGTTFIVKLPLKYEEG